MTQAWRGAGRTRWACLAFHGAEPSKIAGSAASAAGPSARRRAASRLSAFRTRRRSCRRSESAPSPSPACSSFSAAGEPSRPRCTSRGRIVRVTKFASSSARCSASLAACSRSSLTHISSILPSWSFFLRARAALPRIPPARLISWFCCDCEEAAAALSDSYR